MHEARNRHLHQRAGDGGVHRGAAAHLRGPHVWWLLRDAGDDIQLPEHQGPAHGLCQQRGAGAAAPPAAAARPDLGHHPQQPDRGCGGGGSGRGGRSAGWGDGRQRCAGGRPAPQPAGLWRHHGQQHTGQAGGGQAQLHRGHAQGAAARDPQDARQVAGARVDRGAEPDGDCGQGRVWRGVQGHVEGQRGGGQGHVRAPARAAGHEGRAGDGGADHREPPQHHPGLQLLHRHGGGRERHQPAHDGGAHQRALQAPAGGRGPQPGHVQHPGHGVLRPRVPAARHEEGRVPQAAGQHERGGGPVRHRAGADRGGAGHPAPAQHEAHPLRHQARERAAQERPLQGHRLRHQAVGLRAGQAAARELLHRQPVG
mmetsp:Transcript_21574/g.54932  ORF Transcript_21574/g.54932 Transcript_21574/m.54932 type:complete len:369 (-) Transcript_21574:1594-2700(-)